MGRQDHSSTVQVWDPFVRLFHWALVGLVLIAAVTGFFVGARALDIHIWAGMAIGALVLARLVWGFLGSGHARFASFLVGPRAVWAHLGELRSGRADRHLGHNPLGAVMILALLACLAALLVSGALGLGGVFRAGPFSSLVGFDRARRILGLHELLAFGLVGLIAAHVGGAVFESLRTRENLIGSMITGRKRGGVVEEAVRGQGGLARPFAAFLILAATYATAGVAGLSLAHRPLDRVPVPVTGSAYASQCGDCHAAFHPSLLPAASWRQLMGTLDAHFGEDASLPAADAAAITAFLTANAAETADTKPAHLFRAVDPSSPLAITATPAWKRIHARLGTAVFATSAVGSRSNCGACHADAATGWFYPGKIEIPDVAKGTLP